MSTRRLKASKQAGAVIVLFAISLVTLVMIMGAGVEFGLMSVLKRQAQTAADAGAFAGAMALARNQNWEAEARASAAANGFPGADEVSVTNPTTGTLRVVVSRQHNFLFGRFWNSQGRSVSASADAMVMGSGGDAAILALHPTAGRAIYASGSSLVLTRGTSIVANSNASNAIEVGGSASIEADGLWTPGGVLLRGAANAPSQQHTWPMRDPHAHLVADIPTIGSCTPSARVSYTNQTIYPGIYCHSVKIGSGVTIEPGDYVIHGDLDIDSNATLGAGRYLINNGRFRTVSNNRTVNGAGVTVILTSNTGNFSNVGGVSLGNNTILNMSAPTNSNDPFAGILFYQDPRTVGSTVSAAGFVGSTGFNLSGALYFPNSNFTWSGNTNLSSFACTQIVARTVTFTGNTALAVDGCAAMGLEPVRIDMIRLVR